MMKYENERVPREVMDRMIRFIIRGGTVEKASKKYGIPISKINGKIQTLGGFEMIFARINLVNLGKLLGVSKCATSAWAMYRGLPYRIARESRNPTKYVDVKEFWKWAEDKDINLDNAQLNLLNAPVWAYERKKKGIKNHCYNPRWNENEINYLKFYYRQGNTILETSNKLKELGYNRSFHACKHKLNQLSNEGKMY